MWYILIFVLILIAFNILKPKKKIVKPYIQNQSELYSLINSKEINEAKKFISRDYSNALILDNENNLHMFNSKYKNENGLYSFDYHKYSSEQIIKSEVAIDNVTTISHSRGSQLTGMVVGGLALGTVGTLLGGLTGNKTQSNSIKKIDLKIYVDDINNPFYKINFLNNIDIYTGKVYGKGYEKESGEVRAALGNVEKWYGIMEILINKELSN